MVKSRWWCTYLKTQSQYTASLAAILMISVSRAIPAPMHTQSLQSDPWKLIAPFFSSPTQDTGKMGAYRSPLLFKDGTQVKNAEDWQRRRAEILAQWNDLMGPWPPVIEKPKMEVVSETRRENFLQRRVRLE